MHRDNSFANNSEDFLAYDVWADGFIKGGEPFVIKFDQGKLLLNDTLLPKPCNDKYVGSINVIMDRQRIPADKRKFTVYSEKLPFPASLGKLTSEQILKVREDCRRNSYGGINIAKEYKPEYYIEAFFDRFSKDSILVNALYRDNILERPVRLHVKCNDSDCWVNDSQINENIREKYAKFLYEITGFNPTGKNDFTAISYSIEEVKRLTTR